MKKACFLLGFLIAIQVPAGLASGQGQIIDKKITPKLPLRPDLTARIDHIGAPAVAGGNIEVPLTVTVHNAGPGKVGIFKVSTSFEVLSGTYAGPATSGGMAFTVPGQADVWNPTTAGDLNPQDSVTFRGKIVFDRAYSGTRLRITVTADSAAGDEFMSPYGRINEANENNNTASQELTLAATGAAAALRCYNQIRPGSFQLDATQLKFIENRERSAAYAVTLVNDGTATTGELTFIVDYEISRGSKPGLPASGQVPIPDSARRGASLAPRQQRTYELPLSLPIIFAGLDVKFRTRVQSPGGTIPDGGTFQTPWSVVRYIPKVEIEIYTEMFRNILEGKIFGLFRLNNFTPTSDYQLDNEPFRQNDSYVIIDKERRTRPPTDEEKYTPDVYRYNIGDDIDTYYYYINDLNGSFGERESFAIKDGKFMLTIKFETGGGPEFTGWDKFVYWYDSPPDFKLSKFDLFIYLTPTLRDGKVSYSDIGIGMDIQINFASSHWGRFDKVLGATIGSSIIEKVRKSLPEAIREEVKKQLDTDANRTFFEQEVEKSVREQIRKYLGSLADTMTLPIESIRGGRLGTIIVTLAI